MIHETPGAAALRLADEHVRFTRFAPLPVDRIGDLDYAYAVQDALVANFRKGEGSDAPLAGWKIGLTTKRMQALCGVDSPIAGAVLGPRVHSSPARLSAADYLRLGLEMELAVRIGRPLRDELEPDAVTIADCVDAVCAAIEIIEDRDADYDALDACSLVADNSWNAGIILGSPVERQPGLALVGREGLLTVDGVEIDRGRTEDAGGDPLIMVAWLEKLLRRRGLRLEAGQWVMTGSIVPTRFAAAGQHYRFAIDGLAGVEVAIV